MITTISILFALILFDWVVKRRTYQKHGPILLAVLYCIAQLFNLKNIIGKKVKSYNRHYYYNSCKNAVIFSPEGYNFSYAKAVFDVEDLKTFEPFENLYWAKDNSFIYFKAFRLDYLNIDLESFEVKAYSWARDKNYVYSLKFETWDSHPVEYVYLADPKTYQAVDCEWGQDADRCFYRNKPTNIDAESSKILNSNFVQDKKGIYVIPSAKPENNIYTFEFMETPQSEIEVIDTYCIKDRQFIYAYCSFYKGEPYHKFIKIAYLNPNQIKTDINEYMRVDHKIYYQYHEIPNADADSFTELENFYYKDKNRLYFEGYIFDNVDFETLKYNKELFVYEDKNYRYERENKIKRSTN